ncbi:hypothetical protein NM688_g8042 [Phlebia brevispora]|uniref:Uncharacterized protein n=1 Tax=Phlebia brevispora TaxID=194682 RepID=A0ACC1RY35_9APHY|nr:hypothetical protein NM688_g8042 [Phlebia brevispora]
MRRSSRFKDLHDRIEAYPSCLRLLCPWKARLNTMTLIKKVRTRVPNTLASVPRPSPSALYLSPLAPRPSPLESGSQYAGELLANSKPAVWRLDLSRINSADVPLLSLQNTSTVRASESQSEIDDDLATLGYRALNLSEESLRALRACVSRAEYAQAALALEVKAQNDRLAALISMMELTQQKSAEVFQGLLETHERYNVIQRDLRRVEQTIPRCFVSTAVFTKLSTCESDAQDMRDGLAEIKVYEQSIPIVNLDEADTKSKSYICSKSREYKAVFLATLTDLVNRRLQCDTVKRENPMQIKAVWKKQFALVDLKRAQYRGGRGAVSGQGMRPEEGQGRYVDWFSFRGSCSHASSGRIPLKLHIPRNDQGQLAGHHGTYDNAEGPNPTNPHLPLTPHVSSTSYHSVSSDEGEDEDDGPALAVSVYAAIGAGSSTTATRSGLLILAPCYTFSGAMIIDIPSATQLIPSSTQCGLPDDLDRHITLHRPLRPSSTHMQMTKGLVEVPATSVAPLLAVGRRLIRLLVAVAGSYLVYGYDLPRNIAAAFVVALQGVMTAVIGGGPCTARVLLRMQQVNPTGVVLGWNWMLAVGVTEKTLQSAIAAAAVTPSTSVGSLSGPSLTSDVGDPLTSAEFMQLAVGQMRCLQDADSIPYDACTTVDEMQSSLNHASCGIPSKIFWSLLQTLHAVCSDSKSRGKLCWQLQSYVYSLEKGRAPIFTEPARANEHANRPLGCCGQCVARRWPQPIVLALKEKLLHLGMLQHSGSKRWAG